MRCLQYLGVCSLVAQAVSVVVQDTTSTPRHDLEFLKSGRWLDGCCHVFLDVGANLGHHARMVFEPQRFRGSGSPFLELMWNTFGPPVARYQPFEKSCLCSFGFEANPLHAPYHREIEEAYRKYGWRIQFFTPFAVGAKDGSTTLSINKGSIGEGASIINRDNSNDRWHRNWTKKVVPMFNFVDVLKSHLLHRGGRWRGKVLMKMDIEGAEFSVLPELLRSGVLCQNGGVDITTVEWHEDIMEAGNRTYRRPAEIKQSIKQQHRCTPTEILNVDDEFSWSEKLPLPG